MERRISLFFPLALIAAGILWIMIQIKLVQPSNLWALVYLWPFFLIAVGLGLILRSFWKYSSLLMDFVVVGGAFLAVFFAPQLGWTHAPDYVFNGNGFFAGPSERGSGKIISEIREVKDFTKIQISYPAQVVISQGEAESLTIEADDNVAAVIHTEVVNGVLEIDNLHGHLLIISPTRPPKITIVVKDLAELDFESAGDVHLNGIKTDNLKLILDGAGSVNLDNAQLKTLDCNLNGVGSMHASGTVDTVNARVQGLGNFDGGDLHSQSSTVNLDGLGNATVWVDKDLKANVSGMGSINYYGAAKVNKIVDGLGSIKYIGNK
jgi:hypothetical protein